MPNKDDTVYLWHVEQDVNRRLDAFTEAIVAARDLMEAKVTCPGAPDEFEYWAHHEDVRATLIGVAAEGVRVGDVFCAKAVL